MSKFVQLKEYLPKDILLKIMSDLEWKDLINFTQSSKTIYRLFKSTEFKNIISFKRSSSSHFKDKILFGDPVLDYYKTKAKVITKYYLYVDDNNVNLEKCSSRGDHYLSTFDVLGDPPKTGSVYYITISLWDEDYYFQQYIFIHDNIEKAYTRLYNDWESIIKNTSFLIRKEPNMDHIKNVPEIQTNSYFEYKTIYSPQSELCQYRKFLVKAKFP